MFTLTKRKTAKLLMLCFISLISYNTYAQEFQLPKHLSGRKHGGFFLSMALGLNNSNVSIDTKNYGYGTMKGSGPLFDFKIGGSIAENLILHATILSYSVTGPKVNSDDWAINNYKTDNEIYFSGGMFGVGLTYYTLENYFISSSLGLGGLTYENERDNISVTSDNGFNFQIKAGKEWWVSSRWGLGVAVYYNNANILNQEGNDAEEKIKINNLGILFNATLNGR